MLFVHTIKKEKSSYTEFHNMDFQFQGEIGIPEYTIREYFFI